MPLASHDLIPIDFNYDTYILENKINNLFGDAPSSNYRRKSQKTPTYSVDPSNTAPCPSEYDDLARLHYLIRSRKVLTVLEFGIGKSSIVMGDALKKNRECYSSYTDVNLRRLDAYKIYSIDNVHEYIADTKEIIPTSLRSADICRFHFSELHMGDFLGRICTYYSDMPNLCPDIIYLDGPNQYSASGTIRGNTTGHQDRMPMAADILTIEHFLQPSTLIVVDGRTANARFLQCNLQRNWAHYYNEDWDQHFFELQEPPLGAYNQRMIDFCLGESYYRRIR